jgi:hypothetical protein
MSVFNFSSFFTAVGIFILGTFIYSNPRSRKSLYELGSFCQVIAFLISLIFALKNYEVFVRANSDSYYEFWYLVTLNIYSTIINLVIKIFVRFKYKEEYEKSKERDL